VRSLARDIAARLGTCAHVAALRRTRVGGFGVEEAVSPDAFASARDLMNPRELFARCPSLRMLEFDPVRAGKLEAGTPPADAWFPDPVPPDGLYGAFRSGGDIVALVERGAGRWRCRAVFPGVPP